VTDEAVDLEDGLPVCETCGNAYDEAFEIIARGDRHVFDSFECAIEALAPRCAHCNCRIIGHGTQVDASVYCCAHCARHGEGGAFVRDRVDSGDGT
jgi:hypothetical protein